MDKDAFFTYSSVLLAKIAADLVDQSGVVSMSKMTQGDSLSVRLEILNLDPTHTDTIQHIFSCMAGYLTIKNGYKVTVEIVPANKK